MNDPLPKCPDCNKEVQFIGNETPDGKWVKDWKHHFMCPMCGRMSYQRSNRSFFFLIGTESKAPDEDETE